METHGASNGFFVCFFTAFTDRLDQAVYRYIDGRQVSGRSYFGQSVAVVSK